MRAFAKFTPRLASLARGIPSTWRAQRFASSRLSIGTLARELPARFPAALRAESRLACRLQNPANRLRQSAFIGLGQRFNRGQPRGCFQLGFPQFVVAELLLSLQFQSLLGEKEGVLLAGQKDRPPGGKMSRVFGISGNPLGAIADFARYENALSSPYSLRS